MQYRMRMLAAGAAIALLTGTAGAAAAATSAASPSASSAPSSSSALPAPKPSPTGTDNGGGKPGNQDQWLAQLAASLHVSVQKLQTALIDAKQTIGRLNVAPTDPAVIAVVTHDLGISADQAKQLLTEVFGTTAPGKDKGGFGGDGSGKSGLGKPGKAPAPGVSDAKVSQTLAGVLHVSDARAAQVLEQLRRLAETGRGDLISDPRFGAIAASLHITPQQLDNALVQTKEDLRASMPTPSDSPS